MFAEVETLQIYQIANEISDEIWNVVVRWDYFSKQTIGRQLTLAVDSIAANIAEGYGRYHYKEVLHFFYYARASLQETKCWLEKANARSLLSEDKFNNLYCSLNTLAPKINSFINSRKSFIPNHPVTKSPSNRIGGPNVP